MGENIFAKFNEMFDVEGLKNDIANIGTSTKEFVEVPVGDYEVKIVKLELGVTGENSKTPGAPKASVWFEILAGEFKGQKIFMTQMLTTPYGFHNMNQLLVSLETGIPVSFENFVQYDDLFKQIFAEIDGRAEYQLNYDKNAKGFSTYTIVQRF